jgi:hypothetical protein
VTCFVVDIETGEVTDPLSLQRSVSSLRRGGRRDASRKLAMKKG